MRFGYTIPNNWGIADVEGLVALGPAAEERGFDSLWVNHHLLNIGYVRDRLGAGDYFDALTLLTWVAARTSKVRLGTSVLVLPYCNPFGLAKSLATLDVLSGGRVIAGLGVGSLEAEHAQVASVDYADRGAWTDEAIGLMRALWTEDEPAFEGRWLRVGGAHVAPKPTQTPLPVVIGGNRRPALRRVARFAQGWHPLGPSPEGLRTRLVTLDEELAAVGRSRADIQISLRWDIRPGKDVAPLLEEYAAAGVDEVVWSLSTPDLDEVRRELDRLAAVAATYRG